MGLHPIRTQSIHGVKLIAPDRTQPDIVLINSAGQEIGFGHACAAPLQHGQVEQVLGLAKVIVVDRCLAAAAGHQGIYPCFVSHFMIWHQYAA